MAKMSRDKGKRFEREVSRILTEHGYDAHRTAQYRGNTGKAGDVEGVPYIHIEAKHQERMKLYDWIQQSCSDAEAEGKDNIPVVIHKANNKPVIVSMLFDDWIKIYTNYKPH